MKHLTVREIALCGLFIALITVGTFIRIPIGTGVYTLQFLFTLLAGLVLGARLGAVAVCIAGAVGSAGICLRWGPSLFTATYLWLSAGLHFASMVLRVLCPQRLNSVLCTAVAG